MRTAAAGALGLTLGLAGGLAFHALTAAEIRAEAAASADRAEHAEGLVGAACEPVYLAAWPSGACRPAMAIPPWTCEVRLEVYRYPDQADALARLAEAGPGWARTLIEERGARERRIDIRWKPERR